MRSNKLLFYTALMAAGFLQLGGLSALNLQLSKDRQTLVQEVNKAIQAGDFEKAGEGIEQFKRANQRYQVRELSKKLSAAMAVAKEAKPVEPKPEAELPALPEKVLSLIGEFAAEPEPEVVVVEEKEPAAPPVKTAAEIKKEGDVKAYFAALLGDKKDAADAISIDDLVVLHEMFTDIDSLADTQNIYNTGIVFDKPQYFFKMRARDKGADITSKIATVRKSKNVQALLEALQTELEKVAPGRARRGVVLLPGLGLSKEQSKAMGKLNTVRDLLRLIKGESDLSLRPEPEPAQDDDNEYEGVRGLFGDDDEPEPAQDELDLGTGSPFE